MRVSNNANPQQVLKVLRGAKFVLDDRLKNVSLKQFVDDHEDMLADLLKTTLRPNKSLMRKALCLNESGASAEDCEVVGALVCRAVSYCRKAQSSLQSGKKTSKAVKRIAQFLNHQKSDSQESQESEQLRPHKPKRRLSRKTSEESTVEVVQGSSSSSRGPPLRRSRQEIFAAFGLQAVPPSPELIDTDSEDDKAEAQTKPSAKPPANQPKSEAPMPDKLITLINCAVRQTLVRLYQSGKEEVARMQPGPAGFAVVVFLEMKDHSHQRSRMCTFSCQFLRSLLSRRNQQLVC